MSITIDENIIGIWFADTGEDQDYLGALSRCEKGLRYTYRMRTHSPESTDPFDGKDKKKWYAFETAEMDEQKAVAVAREMIIGVVTLAYNIGKLKKEGTVFELLRGDSTVEQFAKALESAPFASVQKHSLQ